MNEHVQKFSDKVTAMHKICADLTDQIQQNKVCHLQYYPAIILIAIDGIS